MKKKSILLYSLLLAMIFAFAAPISATEFTDVNADNWFAEYVYPLTDAEIISGYPDGTYQPQAKVKRGEFVKILAAASHEDLSNYKDAAHPFTDVTSHWSEPNIAWAYANHIVNGRTETTFDPEGFITRQEMAVMLYRFADYNKFTLPETVKEIEFTDENLISDYAKDAVTTMQKAQIINGYPEGNFAPADNATRAEAAKMVYTLIQTMTYVIDLDAEDNRILECNDMTFIVPVEIRGDMGIAIFNNCEFMWDITNTAKEGTRVIIDQNSKIHGEVIFKNNIKEADMTYDMPKVITYTDIRATAKNCIGTVVAGGGASLQYNGINYTIADSDYFEDAEGNILPYTGQEAKTLYIGQWWENGEQVIFKLCFKE